MKSSNLVEPQARIVNQTEEPPQLEYADGSREIPTNSDFVAEMPPLDEIPSTSTRKEISEASVMMCPNEWCTYRIVNPFQLARKLINPGIQFLGET